MRRGAFCLFQSIRRSPLWKGCISRNAPRRILSISIVYYFVNRYADHFVVMRRGAFCLFQSCLWRSPLLSGQCRRNAPRRILSISITVMQTAYEAMEVMS